MQGTTVNGYRFVSLIGHGGMAEVWKAENGLGVCFAIKVLNANLSQDPAIVERFRSEAKIMVALNHPNIRKVIDLVNLSDGRPCIIMEYLDGADLARRMKQGERFTEAQLRKWWNQMVDVLNYTHSQGVIHRDIKPSNIFINESGDVKLLDFGIARTGDGLGTRTGSNMGTLMYMSPEQVTDVSRVSKMSDVYSLAVTFVHLASGKPPYDSALTEYTIMDSIVKTPLDTSALPEPWNRWLKLYLAKEPASRAQLMRITESGSQSEKTQVWSQSIKPLPVGNDDGKTKIEKSLELKISKVPTSFSAKGGLTTIDVVTNGDEPTVSLPSDWIVAQEHFKNGKYQYSLKIYENFWKESRTAQVKIGINRNGETKEETFNITQEGKKSNAWILLLVIGLLAAIGVFCFWYFGSTLSLSREEVRFPWYGGEQDVKVISNRNWSYDSKLGVGISSNNKTKITIKTSQNYKPEEIVQYINVETNNGYVKKTIKVVQEPNIQFEVSDRSISFGAKSQQKTVVVNSSVKWTVQKPSCSFVTLTKYDNEVIVACSENNTTTKRTCSFKIETEDGSKSTEVMIEQEGKKVEVRAPSATVSKATGNIGGHDYVDLGLSVKWATCNVGASRPEQYGGYYAWGETRTKDYYRYSTYSNNPTILPSSADAATANWGSGWRMPTYSEFLELKNKCTIKFIKHNGEEGVKCIGPNGNSIFLPGAGYRSQEHIINSGGECYYWTSSICTSNYNQARIFEAGCPVNLIYVFIREYGRGVGCSIRPVHN